ncbi:TRAP transporter substrate-binding protein [Brevibacillus agri]|uniref:TRAP transporter substrate-binding protein n=1 Tax=Bacillota TaxID=1239 RepID=UPI000271A1C5|nr:MULTISPECIES: TRAP transporter substrate-binding protein [Bacillota]ELK39786.1 TRAP-type C4-dicarboxylate transport system, periplasmic component [Brevibacillus agri BAB-2500]EJL46031.1 tripartite ATP-independent periplasmic transporter solute receptor, DctP family [Brevibacillus sp. CF112]MBG9566698.1 C4-dicarboxylate ABC transporter substrate-binding protein [Brevibacillus agri]MBY0052587.1 DctP family TRAP transporter solute-binding subunit [Brevibacillus agri]MCG5251005.1 TRAP transport
MSRKKWSFVLSGIMSVSLLLAACGGGGGQQAAQPSGQGGGQPAAQTGAPSSDGQSYVFKAGHSLTEDHPYHLALKKMAEDVDKRSNGKVKIEVYPLSQLGAERELTEALTFGTADMSITSTAPVTNFYAKLGVLDLPFLFESREQAYKVLDGKVGEEMLKNLESANLVGLAWAENGFRHITNGTKDIKKPEDVSGMKIRTQENPIHLAAFETLGAKPTPMAWTEALTALQQGVVDAQENPAIVAQTYKLYDSKQTHMSLTGHVYSAAMILFSKPVWDKLPADVQQLIAEEAKKAGQYERELMIKMEEEAIANLKAKGVVVTEDVDKQAFREAMKPVYDKFSDQFGKELVDEIVNTK